MFESHSTDAELALRTRELDLRERELVIREQELAFAIRKFEAELEQEQHTAEHLAEIREMFERVAQGQVDAIAVSPNSRGRA